MIPVLKPHSQTFLLLHSDILLLPDMLTLHRVSFTQRSVVGPPFCHCLVLLLFYNTFISLSVVITYAHVGELAYIADLELTAAKIIV